MTHEPLTAEDLESPILDEVRRIKRKLSESYPDFHSMCEDIRRRQWESGRVVVQRNAKGEFEQVYPAVQTAATASFS